ncbi:MAG: diguanylate cyclase, partial [Oscillospiraceae bacterium]
NCKSCLVVENGDSYDEAMEKVANYKMSGEHKKAFMSLFASKNVLSEFKNGKNEFKLEYELFEADGKSMWMETTLRLISDLQTGEIKGCLYVTDIEKKKREELKLLRELEIDKLTDVYNKCAAERLISEKLKTPEGIQTGVFMMLDIDRFKNVNDTYGHPFGDKVLIETAKILISSFRNIDIVGRLGGDEFCIFFCGINTKRHLEEMSAVLCDTLRCALSADVAEAITVSIGIATCCGKIKSFEEIYKEADKALYAVKDAGRNGFAFYGDGETNGDAKWIQNSEWILNKMNAGVYICDKESFDLLYANDKLLEIIDMKRSACLGKKCYEVFEGRTSPCESCDMKNMSLDQTFSSVTNFPLVSKQFLLNGKLVNRNKKSVLLGIITDSNDILQ